VGDNQAQRGALDPVLLEVMRSALYSVAEEMIAALVHTAYSTNIKDRRDCSGAIYLPDGQVVAQSDVGVPLHLGVMSAVVQTVLAHYALDDMSPGDDIMVNTPYPAGPGHLNDITLVSPVFYQGDVIALVANLAHHVDVGGSVPGSMPADSIEIFQEGLQIPPVKIVKRNQLDRELLAFFLSNIRTATQGQGDLMAQVAANNVGERRIIELVEKHGLDGIHRAMMEIIEYSERRMRAAIREVPNGVYSFEDYLEWPNAPDGRLTIRASVAVEDEKVTVDFSGTSTQIQGPLNCRRQTAETCTYYVLKALLDPGLPPNSGAYRPITVEVPEGSLLHARFPASIVHSNIITSQRIVDVLLGAFLQAVPERAAAASSGTMNLIIIGGIDPRSGEYFSYMETYGGGQGAMPFCDGMDGVHTHMTNTRNAPVEVIEATYPLRVECYGLVVDSEGAGTFRGGLGMVREVIALTDATLTVASDREEIGPWGVNGGLSGATARFLLKRNNGIVERLPSKVTRPIRSGERITTITPGGGGWGNPQERDPEAVRRDLRERIISAQRAAEVYGVANEPDQTT
jgi:N-methylhydantoinase B